MCENILMELPEKRVSILNKCGYGVGFLVGNKHFFWYRRRGVTKPGSARGMPVFAGSTRHSVVASVAAEWTQKCLEASPVPVRFWMDGCVSAFAMMMGPPTADG